MVIKIKVYGIMEKKNGNYHDGLYRGFVRFLIWGSRGGCQNYGPFLDPYYNTARKANEGL